MTPLLHSKIEGKGKPLLILHGFLGMSDNWKTLGLQYAEAGFEVHMIDQRNHGKSFWSPNFNYDLMAEDLNTYMKRHEIAKVAILGHSMGGKTAMQFACEHPSATEKLLVADIAPKYYPPHHQPIIDALNAIDLGIMSSRGMVDEALGQFIRDTATRQFLLKNLYWKSKGQLDFRFNLNVLSESMNEIGENIGSHSVYDGATLFLRGNRSEYITMEDLEGIRKHFPKATLETIENSGHWLHAENPKQFFEKSILFLKQ